MTKLIKKIRIETTIRLKTGLHIGGSKENVEIGGVDLPVIKLAANEQMPYIPGSSLKGKMRCLLEQSMGSANVGGNEKVNKLFGITKGRSDAPIPSRLIVRDAMMSEKSVEMLKNCSDLDMVFTEVKFENTINRSTGVAKDPRQIERVPAGVEFNVVFIVNIWDDEDVSEADQIALLKKGVKLLENDYLGGCGSRGYGQVEFLDWKETVLSDDNNWSA
ncbi:MAG: type III-A CRISPR-associated RAMP protein Csm3 [Bacteroidales bacterium]|nr:type III-A CRISPR-associated RAMP protein Csm3 [Bacteroidales bacterium]